MALSESDSKILDSSNNLTGGLASKKHFNFFTILLNEEKPNIGKPAGCFGSDTLSSEDAVQKLARLLQLKIQAHGSGGVERFTPDQVIKKHMPTLVSIMFRLAAEDFVKSSKATFKIIECRHCTKLTTDWRPSLVDVILDLGHQVVMVNLCDFPHWTDFANAVLRQFSYEWRLSLPRSIFYPDDVCSVDRSADGQLICVTPQLPDDDIIDLASRIQDNLKYEIIRIMQESCANGLRNHLLKRDLRVGSFLNTELGLQTICHVYRTLQRRLKEQGQNIQMGKTTEDIGRFLQSLAGDSLVAAEAFLEYCNNPRPGLTPRKEKTPLLTLADESEDVEQEQTPRSDLDILDEILDAVKQLLPDEGGRLHNPYHTQKEF